MDDKGLQEQVKLLRESLIAAQPYLPGAVLTNNMGAMR